MSPVLPDVVRIPGGHQLQGSIRTPGDKSISHRALLLAALADGRSIIRGLSDGDDVARTLAALVSMGVTIEWAPGLDPPELHLAGGRDRLKPADSALDCGNSGTGLRLLAGLLAGLPFRSVLTGDDSLSARPMDRIAEPLTAMGAVVSGRGNRVLPPLEIEGGGLTGVDWTMKVASAQLKSCILMAGLNASGETIVREPVLTRAHTEEMLADFGADISVAMTGEGRVVRLRASELSPQDVTVPGDPSQAAFWIVAGCLAADSTIVVENVYSGEERIGFVRVLQRMGAQIDVRPTSSRTADLVASSSTLTATVVEASEIPSVDEVPILAVAAACANGTTEFRNVGELRVKEVDRLTATAEMVRTFGAQVEIDGDTLRIGGLGGSDELIHGHFASGGDHRMAMAASIGALVAGAGESTIEGFDAVGTSYPGFLGDLERISSTAGGAFVEETVAPDPVGSDSVVTGSPASGSPADGSRIVAIDGPAGSGKSTVSKAVARRLGVERLDTGAMYRAVAWAALQGGVDPEDAGAVTTLARSASLQLDGESVKINGTDVSSAIRSPEVSRAVSTVAANPDVRTAMVERQRQWAADHEGRGVVEGRDIGTVVFPDARLKIYLTASPEERARRRNDEAPGGVARRDHIDSTRSASPLYKADDARLLDTTDRSVEDVVEEVLSWL